MLEACEIARPVLPPPFNAIRHDGRGSAVTRAVVLAPDCGAGTLVWHLGPGRLDLAVVLEPDRRLAEARAAFLVCMAAAVEAIAAHGAPERSLEIVWPGWVRFDHARLGRGVLVWPPECSESDEPAWLVFGLELIADREGLCDPGLDPDATSLREEGFDLPMLIVESFARHLMLGFDTWAAGGLNRAARPYLDGLAGPRVWREVDPTGGLLERGADGAVSRRDLADALRADEPASSADPGARR